MVIASPTPAGCRPHASGNALAGVHPIAAAPDDGLVGGKAAVWNQRPLPHRVLPNATMRSELCCAVIPVGKKVGLGSDVEGVGNGCVLGFLKMLAAVRLFDWPRLPYFNL